MSLGDGPYIGIGWKSANMSLNRVNNYAPLSAWKPVFLLPNVTFINLQYKDFKHDIDAIKNDFGVKVHHFDDLDLYDNLDDMAALCTALSAAISIIGITPLITAGVGTLTKLAMWRQSSWNNILHYPVGPRVSIFERDTWEPWDSVFSSIADEIRIQFNLPKI